MIAEHEPAEEIAGIPDTRFITPRPPWLPLSQHPDEGPAPGFVRSLIELSALREQRRLFTSLSGGQPNLRDRATGYSGNVGLALDPSALILKLPFVACRGDG
jgi:hypothetical protein